MLRAFHRQAHQEAHETLDQFHTRLRTLAQTCSFNDVDFEIEQQIITAGLSSRIRKKALRDPTYDLKSILLDGRRDGLGAYQARDIKSKDANFEGANQISRKVDSDTDSSDNNDYLYQVSNDKAPKTIETRKRVTVATFYVTKTSNSGNLISATTAQELGLVSLPASSSRKQQTMTEEHVNFVARNSVPKAMTLVEVEAATNQDETLKGVRAAIKLNKWCYDIVEPFKAIKEELTVTSKGVVLRGSRIVMPKSLQQRAIDIAHETHLGLTKTKALLRENIWFANIDQQVKKTLDGFKPYNTKITITPDETEVGKSVIITCHSEGRPEPRYNITHNRIVLSTGKPYHIFKAKVSDAGTYECITWNELGLNDSAFAYLTVEVKPNTKITFEPESAVIGSPCIITCDSSGFPAPNHTITHNGTEVTTNKTYTIDVVKWSDAGIYKCVAKNVLGNYSASANLTVTEPPSPTTRPPTEPLSTSKESDTTTSPDISSSNDASSGIEWYIIAVILVSGIIIVILLSYIVWCSRRRWVRNRKPEQNPEAQTTEADTTYQALDLTKMNTEDDYQSLRNTKPQSNPELQRTEVDTTYQALDLSKMNTEDNYQSLRNRGPELNPETKTTEADTTYQELDLSKMNTEDNYQSLRVNAASNEAVDDDESTYTELSKTRDEENKYQSLK
ncbi:Potassium channel subfamily T member 1 [Paramuricea clavata]|uniref:Potassium channel subfamily T member 1 n=1 Tax=Paramuricea clavata TaxID=317549 RepID=A0A6S7JCY1_PARCT|nr:Potassium channel subfamily T member 1 [Paramuricea clavata]